MRNELLERVFSDGGDICGNCGQWRILKRKPWESLTVTIEECGNCHDEEYNIFDVAESDPFPAPAADKGGR